MYNSVMAKSDGKIRVALLTYAVDGQKAQGTAIVARKSVEAFARHRDEFDVTLLHYDPSDDPIYTLGFREVLFPTFRIKFLNRRSLRMIYYFLTTKDRYDVMQWFLPRLYPLFWLAPARYIIATLHGAGDLTPDGRFILSRTVFNWTLKLFHRKVRMALAGSEYARKDIIRGYGFDAERVVTINYAAEHTYSPAAEAEIKRVKKKYDLPEKFFLGLARHIPTKNVVRTMQAFDVFCEKDVDSGLHFVHVGRKDVDTPRLEEVVRNSKYGERIHMVNYVDENDMRAIYSAAYALVFPILNEGLGLPTMEAMRCGTPTVTSHTAFPEIQEDEAVLVDPYRVEEIAAAMQKLAIDPALRQKISESGLEKAKQFTWEVMGEKLIALYREMIKR